MSSQVAALPSDRPRRNPIVRFFSSIWLAIALLALILAYSSILSAYAPVRWTLEMTEMQAFKHWFFVTLIALFFVALLTTSFLRTRWKSVNAGSLMAHVGLLLLIGGALGYFGRKTEGTLFLESPRIEVRARGPVAAQVIGRCAAAPGETWTGLAPLRNEAVRVDVLETRNEGPMITGARVRVMLGGAAPRELELAPGGESWQAAHDGLEVRLRTFPPQNHFYDNDEAALYVRDLRDGRRRMLPVEALPIYKDHYQPKGELLVDSSGATMSPGRPRPQVTLFGVTIPTGWFERWDLPIEVDTGDLPFALTIDSYVPFVAGLMARRQPDGTERHVPVLARREERRATISPRAMSAIRVRAEGRGAQSGWSDTQWVLFSVYPDVDVRPIRFDIPGAGSWELIYSRLQHDLDAAIAAQRLYVEFFPGRRGIKSYHSDVLVQEAGALRATTVETNQICRVGKWTLFQSGFSQDHWSYSILGVGNRVGMFAMNLGWVTVVLGCLYAFYIKPVLLRRARQRGAQVRAARSAALGTA